MWARGHLSQIGPVNYFGVLGVRCEGGRHVTMLDLVTLKHQCKVRGHSRDILISSKEVNCHTIVSLIHGPPRKEGTQTSTRERQRLSHELPTFNHTPKDKGHPVGQGKHFTSKDKVRTTLTLSAAG